MFNNIFMPLIGARIWADIYAENRADQEDPGPTALELLDSVEMLDTLEMLI